MTLVAVAPAATGVAAARGVAAAVFGLALAAVVLVGAATARRPEAPVPTREGYLRRWSDGHGGFDPGSSSVIRGWLVGIYTLARPLARLGVRPSTVTVAGVVVSGLVPVLAAYGGRWLLLALPAVALAGVVDSLDGAVAVLTGRASRIGYVLDSMADRVSDLLYLLAFWLAGAPIGWCVAAGVALGLLEYLRARAGNAGMGEIGVVTVGERPTRIVVTGLFLFAAGLYPGVAGAWASAGAVAMVGVCLAGLAQLWFAVVRALRPPPRVPRRWPPTG